MKKSLLFIASSLLLVSPLLASCAEVPSDSQGMTSTPSEVAKEVANITITQVDGGQIKTPDVTYHVGDTLRLIVTPNKGYSTAFIKVNGQKLRPTKGSYVFKIESKNIAITGLFEKNKVIMSDFEFELDEANRTAKIVSYSPDRTIIPCPFIIPEKVTIKGQDYIINAIKSGAFNASNIQEIEISKNIETIDHETFANVHGLTSITVNKDNKLFASHDNCLYSKDYKTLLAVPCDYNKTSFTVNELTTTINGSALLNNRLIETLTLPNSVTTLNDKCFMFMHSLKNVTLSNNIKTIPSFAFANCNSLEEITIANGTSEIGDRAFYFCAELNKVNLPNTMKTIGVEAFYRCEKLATINLNEGLETIKRSAFGGVLGFEEVILPSTLLRLEDTVFETCGNLTKLVLNEGLKYLGGAVLYRNPYLKSVNIPSSVEEIHYNPFQGTGEGIITVSKDNPHFVMKEGVIYTKDLKTLVCVPYNYRPENLTYEIPQTVTEIGYNAFSLNLYLKKVIIPTSVKKMECAFQEILPNPVTYQYEMKLVYLGTKLEFSLIEHGSAIWNFRANFKGNEVTCSDGKIALSSQTTV